MLKNIQDVELEVTMKKIALELPSTDKYIDEELSKLYNSYTSSKITTDIIQSDEPCYFNSLNCDTLNLVLAYLDERELQGLMRVNNFINSSVSSLMSRPLSYYEPWRAVHVYTIVGWTRGVVLPCGDHGGSVVDVIHPISYKAFRGLHIGMGNRLVEIIPHFLTDRYIRVCDKKYLPPMGALPYIRYDTGDRCMPMGPFPHSMPLRDNDITSPIPRSMCYVTIDHQPIKDTDIGNILDRNKFPRDPTHLNRAILREKIHGCSFVEDIVLEETFPKTYLGGELTTTPGLLSVAERVTYVRNDLTYDAYFDNSDDDNDSTDLE